MCLRAIMNNKFGFNMVIKHKQAINSIALSLIHKKLRTKALVLELLAAICLLKGGHEIILSAFDNFKQVNYNYLFILIVQLEINGLLSVFYLCSKKLAKVICLDSK